MNKQDLLNVTQAAEYLDISRQTVYNYINKDKKFKACSKNIFGKLYFDRELLDEYVKNKFTKQ